MPKAICVSPCSMTLVRQDIHVDVAYIIWKAEPYIALATETFVVRNGKIVMQAFATLAPSPATARA
jgi:hypothetical protein